jgi:spore maturation protein CgeB
MNIAFFASSLVSAYWNGAATYYRGIVRALAERGHRVTFYEPDAFERQQHRDMPDPSWARVVVYPATDEAAERCVEQARGSDLVVKASGVGVYDAFLEQAVLSLQAPSTLVAFWDVDAPATLQRLREDITDPFRSLVPKYDLVFTYGGGAPVVEGYAGLGARNCVPIYNALDPSTHHPTASVARFEADLSFLGNRLPDRERRVESFFLQVAAELPQRSFVLGGNGWSDKAMSDNVRYLGHVYTHDHNAFNVSPRAVLNISRDSMASMGFSPATRVFEAAGAGACLITDAWEGIESFLEPGREVLVAHDGQEVASHVEALTPERAREIGARARAHILAEHTYSQRAQRVEEVLGCGPCRVSQRRAPQPAEPSKLRVVFLGLSITSSWGNGHATTYRGLVRELCARGHDVVFLERDVPWYAENRDLPEPPYGSTRLYRDLAELRDEHELTLRRADLVIVGSYVPDGIEVARWVQKTAGGATAFYDIDTPVTLARVADGTCEYLCTELISGFDMYLSFTGGPTLERLERELGARRALPLYCSVDPAIHFPSESEAQWHLSYMGTYSTDRQAALERLLVEPARQLPSYAFVVAGPQYPKELRWPANVDQIAHLPPQVHRSFYSSSAFTLNITRRAMSSAGWSPSVRLFEAAACGAPIITDVWDGIEDLFVPGEEILLARSAEDVILALTRTSSSEREAMGRRARARVLAAHTAAHRAAQLEGYLAGGSAPARETRRAAHAR